MKKISLYIFLIFTCCNLGLAEEITTVERKIMCNFFSSIDDSPAGCEEMIEEFFGEIPINQIKKRDTEICKFFVWSSEECKMFKKTGKFATWQIVLKDIISNSPKVEYLCRLRETENEMVKKIGFIYMNRTSGSKKNAIYPISYTSLESITESLVSKSKTTSGDIFDVLYWSGIDNKFPHLKNFESKYISEYTLLFDMNNDSLGGRLYEKLYFINQDQFMNLYSDLKLIKKNYKTESLNSFKQSVEDYDWRLDEIMRTYAKMDHKILSYNCNKL